MGTLTIHAFIGQLDASRTHSLSSIRKGAMMVHVARPGERWEVEFFENRDLEAEVFRSDGAIGGQETVEELLRKAAH